MPNQDLAKRQAFLTQLLGILPPCPAWYDWLHRTGELPPDFDALPVLIDLPDPLVLHGEGGPRRITEKSQWEKERVYLKEQFQYWVTGSFPPAPDNLRAEVLNTVSENGAVIQNILLRFGPGSKGILHLDLFFPAGPGPFPVFISGFSKRSWMERAVKRGYIGCLYAGSDEWDDCEAYAALYPAYDFSCLGRRAWGISRVIDYLHTLPQVDRGKIAISDHSRGGKMVAMAAAFDERIGAVVCSSPVAGGTMPWRYSTEKYFCETLEMITRNFPHWFHPRIRFFAGRENKLPVDLHQMVALIAPRACLIANGINESEVNIRGEEEGFKSARKVYEFLGARDSLGLRFRPGTHRLIGEDTEAYLDFFDRAFGRATYPNPDHLLYTYNFSEWKKLSGENIDPSVFPEKDLSGLAPATIPDWESKKAEIKNRLQWALGETPPRVKPLGPAGLGSSPPGAWPSVSLPYGHLIVGRPHPSEAIDRSHVNFSDNRSLTGDLYYPRHADPRQKMPVIILLHPYSTSTGYTWWPIFPDDPAWGTAAYRFGHNPPGERDYMGIDFPATSPVNHGFALFGFDQIGFGVRNTEIERFYQRYPRWSLLGKMVDDLHSAVDLLSDMPRIDPKRIYVMGYSMGAAVGLFSAALDERIAGVVSLCGFTSLRLETREKATDNLRNLAEFWGLLPRLGFFKGQEKRMPFDFHEILACMAPRPLLVAAPAFDQDATVQDVTACVREARKIYELIKPEERTAAAYDYANSGHWRTRNLKENRLRNLELYTPPDFNRMTVSMLSVINNWIQAKF